MKADKIRINGMFSPVGIDGARVRVTWNDLGNGKQAAYQVITEDAATGVLLTDSGRIEGADLAYVPGQATPSQTVVNVTVRLWDDSGASEDAKTSYETAIAPEEITAKWISPEKQDPTDDSDHMPAKCLCQVFDIPEDGKADRLFARLYVTAHGLYTMYINGQRVGDYVLAPGTAQYDKRQPYQTYDVTSLLKRGSNTIAAVLGDGWYRSCSGVHGDRFVFGHDLSLLAQLVLSSKEGDHVEHTTAVITDGRWLAGTSPIQMDDMQQGETEDARIAPFAERYPAREEDFPLDNLYPSDSVPVTEHERFVVRFGEDGGKCLCGEGIGCVLHTPDGSIVLDFGQNLAGYIQLHIPSAKAGQKISLICGESLDENGNFTNAAFHEDDKHETRGAQQTITYTCKDGVNVYKPSFTIMGFRYAKVETDMSEAELDGSTFTAIAVYSDMADTSEFQCSNEDVNKLFANSKWSVKGNFCDVPTDCPTRERAGWTGDAGLFVETGLQMMDTAPVYRKWLAECRACQYPDGKIANIAPTTGKPTPFTEFLCASVGWGDASILVPYALYHWTGDVKDLEDNYEMMTRWYAFLENRAAEPAPEMKDSDDPLEKYVIDTGLDYGEWCEPGSNAAMDMGHPNRAVSTGFYAYSGRLLSEIATILGHEDDAAHYSEIAAKAKEAFIARFTNDGIIDSTHQADYVRALRFDLLPEDKRQANADKLNENVIAGGYHLNTGFLSTPYLCPILAQYGHVDTAYRLLLQDTMPSWLYEVKKGATTIWETWNGIDGENKVHASLNHYSYGAVTGWLLGGVCGIHVADGTIVIRPTLPAEAATDGYTSSEDPLTYAEASIDTYLGRVTAGWKAVSSDKVEEGNQGAGYVLYGRIPDSQTATLVLPDGSEKKLGAGEFSAKI